MFQGRIDVVQWGNGGWRENVFSINMRNMCKELSLLLGASWTSFWEKSGVKKPITCPIAQVITIIDTMYNITDV